MQSAALDTIRSVANPLMPLVAAHVLCATLDPYGWGYKSANLRLVDQKRVFFFNLGGGGGGTIYMYIWNPPSGSTLV